MDLLSAITLLLAGAAVGLLTGLIPGLHVNTLAAAALVHPEWGLALVAVGIVHTFVAIIPSTYIGAAGEETALGMLPAHRMLLDGDGPQAVHINAHAGLVAVLACLPLVLVMKWALASPGQLLPVLDAATPWILCAVLLFLAWPRPLAAVPIMALAALVGLAAQRPMHGIIDVPASPMLPLLAGLFGIPVLLHARTTCIPAQSPHTRVPRGTEKAALRGSLVAAWTAVLPGVTSATATAIAAGRAPPARMLAILGAVNTAHAVLALVTLWTIGRARSGLAMAIGQPVPWTRGIPDDLRWALFIIVGAAILGAAGTRAIDWFIAPRIHRVPARALHAAGLLTVVALVALFTGTIGLAVLALATTIGLLPPAVGVRRVTLTSALLVPALL